jgi:hypothetical protein
MEQKGLMDKIPADSKAAAPKTGDVPPLPAGAVAPAAAPTVPAPAPAGPAGTKSGEVPK